MGYIQEIRALIGSRPLITVAAGVLITNANGHLLLQRRTDNELWGIPGGAMEIGETLEETARRETKEETGLDIGAMVLFGVFSGPEGTYTYPNGDQIVNVSVVYFTRDFSGEMKPDAEESLELRFFAPEEIESLKLTPINKPIVTGFLAGRGLALTRLPC